MGGTVMVGLPWQLRYSLRKLIRWPSFTLTAVLTLALGCGVTCAVFAIVETVLLAPLPYPRGDRLISAWETQDGSSREGLAPAEFEFWRQQDSGFSSLAAYTYALPNLTGVEVPETLLTLRASTSLLDVLGVEPLLGRGFQPGEDESSAEPVVVLSHGLWRRCFGGEDDVLGEGILLDGVRHTVVGVMPEGFRFPLGEELPGQRVAAWMPLRLGPGERADWGEHHLEVVGRLAPGVSLAQARERTEEVARRMAQARPDPGSHDGVALVPLKDELVGASRGALTVLFGAVCCVLLICCANVGNLMLIRAVAQQRQSAVRLALGASRWSVAREWLVESLLLAFLGAAGGLLLARWGLALFHRFQPVRLPRVDQVGVDGTVVLFAFGIALLVGLVTAMVAVFGLGQGNLQEGLREGGRGAGPAGPRRRWRGSLVLTEVALATFLTVGATLLIKSFLALSAVDPGFDPRRVLTSWLLLPQARYAGPEQVGGFYEELFRELETLPGVERAGGVSNLPFTASAAASGMRTLDSAPTRMTTGFRVASPGYFPALGIRLRSGRLFSSTDRLDGQRVAVVNEILARRLWPGRDPIGERVLLDAAPGGPWRVVGVVGSIHHGGLGIAPEPEIYVPHAQAPTPFLVLAVKTRGQPEALADELRRAVLALAPDQPVFNVQPMENLLAESTAEPRLRSALLGLFAFLALTLATVGIYGVVAYSLTERSPELALRMALGAQPRQVEGMVVRSGLKVALLGVGLGLLLAAGLARLMSSLLFGVHPFDVGSFLGVAVLLATTALLASYLPARRAGRISPLLALQDTG